MLNKVILMGRLTRDPELRHTQSDIPVTSFTLAVDRGYSRRDNAPQQTADFINVVAWRNTAEFVSKWFSKGQLVAVSGRLETRSYKDREEKNRTVTEVVADECFFGEPKRGEASSDNRYGDNGGTSLPPPASADFEEVIGDDSELPF